MKKVYIAGPYSDAPEKNVEIAIRYANKIISLGHAPFCPHLSHFLHRYHPRPYETWMKLDLLWLQICDCLFRIPGKSPGADIECKEAAGTIPIFYKFETLKDWLKFNG